jgi:hypothetical protein
MAATITAAARLMLATLETLVVEQGGTWAFADTDSMAVVSPEHGGLIPCPGGPERDPQGRECVRALSWAQIDEIVRQFEALNPYDRALVRGSVLEIEDENYELDPTDPKRKRVLQDNRRQLHCYSFSAKHYALYNLDQHGRPVLPKLSEHGLGHLLDPTVRDPDESPIDQTTKARKWIKQVWQHIVETDALGLPSTEPEWLDDPALTRTTITSPRLLAPFDERDHKRPSGERIRPYNFGLVAHVQEPGFQGVPERFLLVAPYESDPRKRPRLPWTNAYEPGSKYEIVPDDGTGEQLASATDGRVIVKTYRSVLADYRTHPEAKSLGPDGEPCGKQTRGLLTRRPGLVIKGCAPAGAGARKRPPEQEECGLMTLAIRSQEDHLYGEA